MRVTVRKMVELIEELAPIEYALDSDASGLLLGDPVAEVRRVLLALDLTPAVLQEAIDCGSELLVLHHPPLFRPVQQLRYDRLPGKLLLRAVGAGLAIYAAHTSLDVAPGGINDVFAHRLGLEQVSVLAETGRERLYKVVVFVPEGHEDAIRNALSDAGAGHIGNYSHCTFQTAGVGTFRPLAGSNPFIGETGELERVVEIRLETIVPASKRERVIAAMQAVHPYEEVAYDIYPLANHGLPRGLARAGKLASPVSVDDFAGHVRSALGLDRVRVAGEPRMVSTVAVCSGRLAPSLIEEALDCGVELLVAGEIRYHELLQAIQSGLVVFEVGHYCSEELVLPYLAEQLQTRLQQVGADTIVNRSRVETDPIRYT